MSADRRLRLWSLAAAYADGAPVAVQHVCSAVVSVTATDGAAIAVTLAASPRESIYSSSRLASTLEELSVTLGEGPCVDALSGSLTLVPDVSATQSMTRWPAFAPAAVQAGACAIFALPLQVGAIRLGVLDLYRATPGGLQHEQLLDALTLADTVCGLLLDAAWQNAPQVPAPAPEPAGLQHPEVHQATGMMSVQLGLPAAVALVRLRAYAYVHDRRLRDVARDVIARRLRFHPEHHVGSDPLDGD